MYALERLNPALWPIAPLLRIDLSSGALAATRSSLDDRRAVTAAAVDLDGVEVRDREVVSPDGRQIGVRLYRGSSEPAPFVLYLHSGAYVLGNLDTDHAQCVALARDSGCAVVSVDYRLAPAHPFPAAADDCETVLAAAMVQGPDWGLDVTRVALAGSSAGAGLAAGLAVALRDRGDSPVRALLLHQPVLDDRCATSSMREFDDTPGFDSDAARLMWQHYLAAAPATPVAAAARAEVLTGLPPTYVWCSDIDPLRDEALEFAARLLRDGVPTELHVFAGTCHGFDSVLPDWTVSAHARAEMAAALSDRLVSTG